MGDLTKNFSKSEFECRCGCGFTIQDPTLVEKLQTLRDSLNVIYPEKVWIQITGPSRCPEHNEKVQKQYNPNYVPYSSKSKHMEGIACDFKVWRGKGCIKQVPPSIVYGLLDCWFPDRYGIGLYHNRVHLDTRPTKARWDG